MADLKPLGSEKLNGDDKLKRILDLTYYGTSKNTANTSSNNNKKTEFLSESINGFKFGVVKEKDGYYVKKGLNENSLDYIGGLFMKNKNRFSSYAEALKRLQLLSSGELNEATKYVLKQKPATEAPVSDVPPMPEAPAPDTSDVPSPDALPSDDTAPEDLPTDDMGGETPEEGKPSDYMTEIQKYAGKLGQELRDQKQKMESDDIKYVLNMVISAVDLNKLEDDDIEEIGKKFDRDVEDDANMDDDMSDVPADDSTTPAEPGDEDLGEMHAMDKLESFINSPIQSDEEIDLSKYSDLGSMDETKEIDLDEIKSEINKSIAETLGKYFK